MKRAVHAKGRRGEGTGRPLSMRQAGGGCKRAALADRAAGMTAEIPVWPGRINPSAPGLPVLRANGRSMGARAGGRRAGPRMRLRARGVMSPSDTAYAAKRRPARPAFCCRRLPAAPAGEGRPFPLWQHAPAAVQRAHAQSVPVLHRNTGDAFAMAFQKYFSAAACMAAHWASMSATSLNWVRQRSRFWPSRCVLK